MNNVIIGSFVDLKAPNYLVDAVKTMIEYKATASMFYITPPLSTIGRDISKFKKEEAYTLLKAHNLEIKNLVVHAPYVFNLSTNIEEKRNHAVTFLKSEVKRLEILGLTTLVVHPGSHLGLGSEIGVKQLIKSLKSVLESTSSVRIALESMSGKGGEVGSLEELAVVLKEIDSPRLGVCLDTCHLHDYGEDLNNIDAFIKRLESTIKIKNVFCIHINDSKNVKGAHKDRHENIGLGKIGVEVLRNIVHLECFKSVPKILETPALNGKTIYKEEIELLTNYSSTIN